MSARPCSARTSTASSRYACATRVGFALTPARFSDRLPLEQLARTGPAVPGPAFGAVGLELEQITVERMVEARQRGLGAIGRVTQRLRHAPPAVDG